MDSSGSMSVEGIEARLSKLEASNRRLVALLFLLSAAFVLALGATKAGGTHEILRTRRLEIVDERGTPRITSLFLGKGETDVALWMTDNKGNRTVVLGNSLAGPELRLFGATNDALVLLGLGVTDEPGLRMMDRKGNTRALLATRGSTSSLMLYGPNEPLRVDLLIDSNGPNLLLFDDKMKVIWRALPGN